MVYRPYGANNLNTPYIVAGSLGHLLTYLKQYPKPFNPTTIIYKNGYLEYYHYNNLWLWSVRLLGEAIFKINSR